MRRENNNFIYNNLYTKNSQVDMKGFLNFSDISYTGIIMATFVAQVICAIWFSLLINKPWRKYHGWTEKEINHFMEKNNRHTKSVCGAFIEQFISMILFAALVHSLHITTINGAVALGICIWFGFMATVTVNEVLWHGEKIEFYLLFQAGCIMRTIGMAGVYAWIAL